MAWIQPYSSDPIDLKWGIFFKATPGDLKHAARVEHYFSVLLGHKAAEHKKENHRATASWMRKINYPEVSFYQDKQSLTM